jgi:predicted dehydrogenase
MCGSLPIHVHAVALPDAGGLNDTVSINLEFADGSVGTICYFANGSKELPKEYIEIYSSGVTGIIQDFKELLIYSSGRPHRKRSFIQDKGQATMVREFIERVKKGGKPLIEPNEIFQVTKACFKVMESLKTQQSLKL